MANPMAQAAISLESHPGGHVYLYERAPVGATRVKCGLIMVARSATLGSWLVGHTGTHLAHTWPYVSQCLRSAVCPVLVIRCPHLTTPPSLCTIAPEVVPSQWIGSGVVQALALTE